MRYNISYLEKNFPGFSSSSIFLKIVVVRIENNRFIWNSYTLYAEKSSSIPYFEKQIFFVKQLLHKSYVCPVAGQRSKGI